MLQLFMVLVQIFTMLAMATKYKDIYLLREAVHFGKVQEDEFRYLDIPEFKNSLYNELIECLDESFLPNIEEGNLIQDYIFLCFFMGNDFLPRLPALHIKHGAIDYLVDLYKELLCDREEYLVNGDEINIGFLKAFSTSYGNLKNNDYLEIFMPHMIARDFQGHEIIMV